jgi:hypothetical protein
MRNQGEEMVETPIYNAFLADLGIRVTSNALSSLLVNGCGSKLKKEKVLNGSVKSR